MLGEQELGDQAESSRGGARGGTSAETARAKHLPLAKPAVDPPELVPARMINEVLYCERLVYLEWAQGEFADNYFTVDGRAAHRRADRAGGSLPLPAKDRTDDPDPDPEHPEETVPYKARSLWLSSEALGMTAKIDVVEGDGSGRVLPIEYKRGSPPDVPEGAYLPERAQLCAQVLLLRDAGYVCDEAQIYYAKAKRRVTIVIDDALVEATKRAAARAKELVSEEKIPAPLVDSPKCHGCSLVGICLPDELNLLQRLEHGEAATDARAFDDPSEVERVDVDTSDPDLEEDDDLDPTERAAARRPATFEMRRLLAARDERVPLYVQEQGAKIGMSGERLVVYGRESGKLEARMPNTSQVCLLGNVQISTQALRELFGRNIPVSFFSTGGWFEGRATGHSPKNVELRIAQHRAAADPTRCLALARGFVRSKIKNQRTLLRRNHPEPDPKVLFELKQLARKAAEAESIESLLGVEGSAARVYFGAFTGMLKGAGAASGAFDLEGRNRRPPRDPINALLSFAYALLVKDFTTTLAAVGLDPMLGFYHQPRFGRPALALDLMEEFRPLLADSMVVGAINTGVVTSKDFRTSPVGVAIEPAGRRRVILAHERRMDQIVTHPIFGYRVSYRRILEIQARLLGRLLTGEIETYPAFGTR